MNITVKSNLLYSSVDHWPAEKLSRQLLLAIPVYPTKQTDVMTTGVPVNATKTSCSRKAGFYCPLLVIKIHKLLPEAFLGVLLIKLIFSK
jgi:hypothetical protein